MDSLPVDPDDLKRLIALFDEHRLNDLELKDGDVRVRLQAATRPPAPALIDPSGGQWMEEAGEATAFPASAPPAAREPSPEEKGWVAIVAPMTGTFYRSPGPDEPTFIDVDAQVEVDQVVGLIEAMKIFSEIRSETSGAVMEISVQSGQMVQSGQTLVWILPT